MTVDPRTHAAAWQPVDLLERAAREPLGVFRKGVGGTPFLVVRLDDFSNDLGAGLAVADEEAARQRFSRVMKSTLQLSTGVTEQMRVLRTEEQSLSPFKPVEDATAPRHGFPVPEWLPARCYVVRLSTRGDGKTPLSIGRDTSHKIVLQHSSVSATHAYLSVAPELTLADAKSRNGTLVNGVVVKGNVPVKLGDRIKFGAVHAVLCSPDDVWNAVR